MLTATEEKALQPLGEVAQARMLAQVEAWAAIGSGSGHLPGLALQAEAMAEAVAPIADTVELLDGPPETVATADGAIAERRHGRHLRARRRPEAPVRVLLSGHMDTVFGPDHPFQALRWEAPGRLNGPGVADMKGGVAVMIAALHAIEASDAAGRLGWELLVVSDEEVGSPSSRGLLAEAAGRAHWGLTYEPSNQPDGTLTGARWGSGNFAAIITGRAAHAGRNPEEGRNALTAAADLALRLEALVGADIRVNPARIEGGAPNNMVPERTVLRFNVRPRTLEAQAAAQAGIEAAIAAVSAAREVGIHLHGGFARPPKPLDETQRPLFDLVRTASADLGLPLALRDSGGVCDGNNLASHGLPVVDTMGVRGGAIHSDREFLLTDSLLERARLSALVLHRLAHAAPPPARP
jgi:glutamate carboxypeptidase